MYKIIKNKTNDNDFVVVFSPDVESVNQELLNMDLSNFADGSTFKFDLVAFVGSRPERYLEFQIQNGKIDMTTIKKGLEDNVVSNITMQEYATYPLGFIQKIYPISYRDEIMNIKTN